MYSELKKKNHTLLDQLWSQIFKTTYTLFTEI